MTSTLDSRHGLKADTVENVVKQRRILDEAFADRAAAYETRRRLPRRPMIPWSWGGFLAVDNYRYTAVDVVNASMEYSLVGTPHCDLMAEARVMSDFANRLRRDLSLNLNSVDLAGLLATYAAWFDHYFFFSVLTGARYRGGRGIGQAWEMSPWRDPLQRHPTVLGRIVDLKIVQENYAASPGADDILGSYDQCQDVIQIFARDRNGSMRCLIQMVETLAHELSHVYLEIYSTNISWSRHYTEVFFGAGHGVEFWRHNLFVEKVLHEHVPGAFHILSTRLNLEDTERKARRDFFGPAFGTVLFVASVVTVMSTIGMLLWLFRWLIIIVFSPISRNYWVRVVAAVLAYHAVFPAAWAMLGFLFVEWLPQLVISATTGGGLANKAILSGMITATLSWVYLMWGVLVDLTRLMSISFFLPVRFVKFVFGLLGHSVD